MTSSRGQMRWVPEDPHRHSIRVLRGWVIGLAIALGVIVVYVVLIVGPVTLRLLFSNSPYPVVVSSPRDCRLNVDARTPRLFVAIDATSVTGGYLMRASTIGFGREVEAAGVVPSLPPLSALDDAEFVRIVEDASDSSFTFGDDQTTGVVVAIVGTSGEHYGSLNGLRAVWGEGEPAYDQDLPLGIKFTPTTCTVTTAG